MQPHVRIRLDEIHRQEDDFRLVMTIFLGTISEKLSLSVTERTGLPLEAIFKEEPFRQTKAGTYCREVQEIMEGGGIAKTLVVQISKGRSRTKRSVVVDQVLFLTLWNILHFNVLPSQLPLQMRHN